LTKIKQIALCWSIAKKKLLNCTKFGFPGDERLFGIAVIRAESIAEARKIFAKDPAVVNNIQQAEVYRFSMNIRFFEKFEVEQVTMAKLQS